MSLAILPGTTLAQIAAVATSFRLHSGAARQRRMRIPYLPRSRRSFLPRDHFSHLCRQLGHFRRLHSVVLSLQRHRSALLATAPLLAPTQIAATENNFLFSTGITLVERLSAPTLVQT